jgi:hypothetical protein
VAVVAAGKEVEPVPTAEREPEDVEGGASCLCPGRTLCRNCGLAVSVVVSKRITKAGRQAGGKNGKNIMMYLGLLDFKVWAAQERTT